LHPSTLRLTAFGIFWFFIALSVESSIIPIEDVIFEHRVYLPSIGIIIAFVSSIFYLSLQITHHAHLPFRQTLRVIILFLTVVVIIFSIVTYQRNIIWKDEISLWNDVIKKFPINARGHDTLGLVYFKKGELDKAMQEYKIAAKLKPDYVDSFIHLGEVLAKKGLWQEAENYFAKALELKKLKKLKTHAAIGLTSMDKDSILNFQIEQAKKNIGNKPTDESLTALGILYFRAGQYEEALKQFKEAIELNPSSKKAYIGIGNIYTAKNQPDKAISAFKDALKYDHGDYDAHVSLGVLYAQINQFDLAVDEFKKAVLIKPQSPASWNDLGVALVKKQEYDEAMKMFQKAINIEPEYQLAKDNLIKVQKYLSKFRRGGIPSPTK
ncbi:MAG: tetratricopeptide repeat protein, partial [Nitrospirae bacterium]|nr:tetratricopeptide repeat protein [Nitrospirota bacterium]